MKPKHLILIVLASMGMTVPVLAASYTLQTPKMQLVLDATEGQELQVLYFGDQSASPADIEAAAEQHAALPVFGDIDM
ncbi:MAG: hypothetical protein II575_14260, partial [Bacteroidales bacterium]|nr:hypothetical protein [Bacteroidales bacterium]